MFTLFQEGAFYLLRNTHKKNKKKIRYSQLVFAFRKSVILLGASLLILSVLGNQTPSGVKNAAIRQAK